MIINKFKSFNDIYQFQTVFCFFWVSHSWCHGYFKIFLTTKLIGFTGLGTKLQPRSLRRPLSSVWIVGSVTSHNLAWQSIQKQNIRTRSTSVKYVTSHSHEKQMLPGTLMQSTTTWPRFTHASGVRKNSGKITSGKLL